MALQEKQRCFLCKAGWAYPRSAYQQYPSALRKDKIHLLCSACVDRWIENKGKGVA